MNMPNRDPAAMQCVARAQDTDRRSEKASGTTGSCTVHVEPVSASAKGKFACDPTTSHRPTAGQLTAAGRELSSGRAPGRTDQTAPFRTRAPYIATATQ